MMSFQPNFSKATKGNRLSITVDLGDIKIAKDPRQPSFWQQLMDYLEQNKQITELSLVIPNEDIYNALFPKGEELGWVFAFRNVRHLLLSTTPQEEDRISKNFKKAKINGNKCFLYPPLSSRDRVVKSVVIDAFVAQCGVIKKSLNSGVKEATPNTAPYEKHEKHAKSIGDNQDSVRPMVDVEDWMSFFLRHVAMPEVYFFPLVIGFIALLASNSVGMTIFGGGLFTVGALGAGLHFFSTDEYEFENRYYANQYSNSHSY